MISNGEVAPFVLPAEFAGASLSTVPGGFSGNEVFRADLREGPVCMKRFAKCRDAEREWNLLTTLASAGVDCVPQPLMRWESDGAEIVAMTWCDGEGMGTQSLSVRQVDALADALACFGGVTISELPRAANQISRLVQRAHEARSVLMQCSTFDSHLIELIERVLGLHEIDELSDGGITWLGRGDPNLANALWSDRVLFVDLEHAGCNDRAAELADLAEHLQSHECDEGTWTRLWDALGIDGEERRRILLMRGLTAVWWLSMLMSDDLAKQLNPPERVFTQAQRTEGLLRRILTE